MYAGLAETECGVLTTTCACVLLCSYLHDYLQRDFGVHTNKLPRFPRRKSIWSTLSDSTITQRKKSLDEFLKSVISNSHLPLGIVIDAQTTRYKDSADRPNVVL